MNIFILDESPVLAAQYQCDKHVVKMIVESAQMLSTAHRLLDGTMTQTQKMVAGSLPARWRKSKVWRLDDPDLETKLYSVTHPGHPSTIWTMESLANYIWHYEHFCALCDEYTFRYGKTHATDEKLRFVLDEAPKNIPDIDQTPFRLAMQSQPQCINPNDPVGSYRAFYQTKSGQFKMSWTKRSAPDWFKHT